MFELLAKRVKIEPKIYAYEICTPQYRGCLKVGTTTRTVSERVQEQMANIKLPFKPDYYKIVYEASAMRSDGSAFSDKAVHDVLKTMPDVVHIEGEWFRCTLRDVQVAVVAVRNGETTATQRTQDFKMRPEQIRAVEKTMRYYRQEARQNPNITPKFLWNAKMRFGKTFASYQLAKQIGFKRVLILTFKPAVLHSWRTDLASHVDFKGWQFLARVEGGPDLSEQYARTKKDAPIVCFGSFQDFMGVDAMGNIKAHHEWIREINWDLVIFDEYHFGAWRDKAKGLFLDDNEEEDEDLSGYTRGNAVDENYLPITTRHYLFLSGTPFRALNEGEFIESQIFSWTYSDEQREKEQWKGANNPYAALPRMVLLTYQLPEKLRRVALQGDQNEFDLNTFFSTKGSGAQATFVFETEVQSWLDFIRGHYFERDSDLLALSGANYRPPQPFGDVRLRDVLQHTVWYLPNVAACYAMEKLLKAKRNTFYHNYHPVVCAGAQAGIGAKALPPVQRAMQDPLATHTITLTCGKLTTGVTVKPWSGIFMLRNLKSPETYFQAAFRVQSPWTIRNDEGEQVILKPTCYVFDFAPNRALSQVAQYSQKLSVQNEVAPQHEQTPEEKVGEFIHFLPILHYDGTTMRQISAGEILDITLAGTSATLLAKRWESALLVNVDNDTLKRLKCNEEAMQALMRIEAFRALGNNVIETILAKADEIKKVKKETPPKTPKEKKAVDDKEKEVKSLRKQVQEQLIKFATRIPVFMYLTDYREHTLKEVITQIETDLFERVTGLTLKDFELLVSIGLFNNSLMNDAVLNFKRYEDSSLSYTGINRHQDEAYTGAWDTRVSTSEIFVNQG
ncbi:MAG: GIY-YIG nuclease family protein [Kiritimatiellae bacterium]|nr:GIY-YIG nuclease family protein [Kiritimatiellia bacterium]